MGDRLCARCRATWINAEFCWRGALEEIDGLRALTEDQFSVLAAARERIAELEGDLDFAEKLNTQLADGRACKPATNEGAKT